MGLGGDDTESRLNKLNDAHLSIQGQVRILFFFYPSTFYFNHLFDVFSKIQNDLSINGTQHPFEGQCLGDQF